MKTETAKLAREMFATTMTTAQGLDTISKEDRKELFKAAGEMCFEAAEVFEEVSEEHNR